MSASPCPCEECLDPRAVTNRPGLPALAYRVDDFEGFRRALLHPLGGEYALLGWRPAPGDLGLQLLEWWAYLGDVLTFYNERIANESYLRTAVQAPGVSGLVGLLGYSPRPAIGAVGRVAALRRKPHPAEPLVVPDGFQLASTATPGVPVQTWEAAASSFPGPTHATIALPPTRALLKSESSHLGSVLLRGTVAGLKPGDVLLAISKTFPQRENDWAKLTVVSSTPEPDPAGGSTNTRVVLDAEDETDARAWMTGAAAADYRLLRSKQSAALWTQTDDAAISHGSDTQVTVLLSAAVRGIVQGDLLFLDGDNATTVGIVTDATEIFTGVPYPGATDGAPPDIPVAHTQLAVTSPLARSFSGERFSFHVGGHGVGERRWSIIEELIEPAKVAVRYGLKDVGTLIGAPATALTSLPVTVTPESGFTVAAGGTAAFVEDASGAGIPVNAASNGDGTLTLVATADTPASFSLAVPLRLLVDLVSVSRGKSVANETLGTGDATVAGQAFTLQNAPLTYLASGAGVVSALKVAVDGIYWSEVHTFYDQPADARVFVVAQGADGKSSVRFGDGVNGARLPSGSRVVASYRYGAGAARPPAGRLTTILKPQQNLASIHNPVAVWGGADAEQPEDVRSDAPKSVLTFGRAISGDDYETVAALAPGVTRARAYWTWDAAHQRSLVKVYVGDDAAAATSARGALAGAEDPNRPVAVAQATPVPLTVGCTLLVAPDRVAVDVAAAAAAALADPETGLFSPARMGIGRPLYTSQLEAALLVPGVVAVHGLTAGAGGSEIFSREPVGWADPGEGSFYTLATSAITTQVDDGRSA
jgi:Baseplate J-like protein